MYMDETGHISKFFVANLIVYNWEIRVEKGIGKWVRIINIIYMCIYIYTRVATSLKKEARQVN